MRCCELNAVLLATAHPEFMHSVRDLFGQSICKQERSSERFEISEKETEKVIVWP
jgi:hypothetical protein